jgi:hypothetical protein
MRYFLLTSLIASTNEDKAFFKKLKVEYCVFDEGNQAKISSVLLIFTKFII